MKKIYYPLLFFFFVAACVQKKENANVVSSNPLSIRDSKLRFSPEERFGTLFDTIQKSNLFPDIKIFLDGVAKTTTDSIMDAFENERIKPNFNLQSFVNQWFTLPKDVSNSFQGDVSQSSETYLNGFFSYLTRKADTADLGSLLPLPKPYILPNSTAREVNYSDSYFTMLGLQADGRTEMIENMLDNFAYLLDTEGFIPYGNRSYYMSRSQPPYFACMVQLLAAKKGDSAYLKYLPQLEKEYKYWMDGKPNEPEKETSSKRRTVVMDRNTLNRYFDDKDTPRPERFREDTAIAKKSNLGAKMANRHLRAAAESGWEYSSRWFETGKDISSIHTTDFVPVDLNSLLYNLEMVIMKGKIVAKKLDEAANFEKLASKRREAVMRYCWNEEKGMFYDFDFQKYKRSEVISLAAVYPLFFRMCTKREADKAIAMIQTNLLRDGGLATTATPNSVENWDGGTGHANLHWMAIQGLRNYGYYILAADIKKRWVDLNITKFKSSGKMFENYSVDLSNNATAINEATLKAGSSSSNGVLLKLLKEK